MSPIGILAALPDDVPALRLNLERVLSESGSPGLVRRQILAAALASAIASRHRPLTDAIASLAADALSAAEVDAVRETAVMADMSTLYHRAIHLLGDAEYRTLRTGLRLNLKSDRGIDSTTFELSTLAVATINGCAACLDAHEKELRQRGIDMLGVQSVLRIAAVIHAVAVTLEQGGVQAGT